MKQKDHTFNAAAVNMITNFKSHSLGTTISTEKAIKDLLANEAQFSASYLQVDMEDDFKENQGEGEGNIRRMKETGELDKNCMQSSIKETSLKYSSTTADVVLGNIQSHGLSKSREKCKTLIQKVAPTGKLWDGCLLLNSSVTVSAVAFFKSGEKMPGVKWSESVEVKGKVKLDDFEKYIQDLPHSRNRGLMVVSLCWKEGSSRLGLAGMKKVSKRYQEGERVGFAQLSPGIDLYVCPRTETIITILAKHGFFKGKTAIEENRDSMIGCVVWRRNKINLNSVELKSERCTHQVAESKVSAIHLPPESFLESSGKNRAALDAKQKDRIEGEKNLSKSPLGVHKFPTSCKALTSQSTPSILPSVPAGPETSDPYPEYRQVSMEQSPKLESHVDKSGEEQQDLKFKPGSPVLALPPDVTRQPSPIVATEDLPEFNFGASCGIISQAVTNRALDTLTVNKNLPDKGFRHMDGSVPLTTPTPNSWPTLHKRRLENISHRGLSSYYGKQKIPPQKKICMHDNVSMLPPVLCTQSRDMRKPFSMPVAPPAKNLFYHHDDMPQWCPQDVNLEKQSILVANQSSNFPIHCKEPKLIHPVQSAAVQNPFSSSACVAADQPPFSTQTPHFGFHAFHGPVFRGHNAQRRPVDLYIAKGPTSSMEINRIQPFRSNSCLINGKLPINHGVWKGWMS